MICCSLKHRGEELLGQRDGLRAYVDHYSTMGIPFLHPWANRLGADRFELAGRAGRPHPPRPAAETRRRRAADPRPAARRRRAGGSSATPSSSTAASSPRASTSPPTRTCSRRSRSRTWSRSRRPWSRARWRSRPASPRPATSPSRSPSASIPTCACRGCRGPSGCWRRRSTSASSSTSGGLPTGEREPTAIEPGPLGERTYDDAFLAPSPGTAVRPRRPRPAARAAHGQRLSLHPDLRPGRTSTRWRSSR